MSWLEVDNTINQFNSLAIGIDTGVNTGFASWSISAQQFSEIKTYMIHQATRRIEALINEGYNIHVRVEDARKAVYGRSNDKYKAQGAGSVKRDAKIWEDFLIDLGVSFEMVRPQKGKTKLTSQQFSKLTKYTGRTSQHGRDAGMIVFGTTRI